MDIVFLWGTLAMAGIIARHRFYVMVSRCHLKFCQERWPAVLLPQAPCLLQPVLHSSQECNQEERQPP